MNIGPVLTQETRLPDINYPSPCRKGPSNLLFDTEAISQYLHRTPKEIRSTSPLLKEEQTS